MKKILGLLIVIMSMFTLTIKVKAEDLVKVYVFEAGGCPWCEREKQYLEGLESYNKKFEIVTKELYVDHETWAQGADYDLGVKVANYFQQRGFTDAKYTGTPFVVISDLYAAATYSTDLESYIDKAYEEGDKDIVGMLANEKEKSNIGVLIAILVVLVGGVSALVVVANHDSKKNK